MMARSSKAPSIGRIQKRKTNFSKSSLSACNARPVHTDGPLGDVSISRWQHRGLPDLAIGHANSTSTRRPAQVRLGRGPSSRHDGVFRRKSTANHRQYGPHRMSVAFKLNGKAITLDADPDMPLLWAIREVAGLHGTKYGCGIAQCGYCQSGQIMSATALLEQNPKPNDADINDAMRGNICRCSTYPRIRAAIHAAAHAMEG